MDLPRRLVRMSSDLVRRELERQKRWSLIQRRRRRLWKRMKTRERGSRTLRKKVWPH